MTARAISDDQLRATLAELEQMAAAQQQNRLAHFRSYGWQAEFIALGATKRERLALAGNRTGKSEVGAYEVAMHLTGNYPPDWKGRRFAGPITAWAASDTAQTTRDVPQLKLMGLPGQFGTGMIPKAAILDWKIGKSISDGVDVAYIRHKSGGTSTLQFKFYEQGRAKWQGSAVHVLWCDEEPPIDIYSEGITRLGTTRGIALNTLTPLKGMTDLVSRFMDEESPDRAYVTATIDDALHIPEAERARIIAGYPAHERESRARGVPLLGEGRVFPFPEEIISVKAFTLPGHWPVIGGLDFGIGHPFAAVELAWDRDADTVYVTKAHRVAGQRAFAHVEAIKPWGTPIWAWPHDGAQRDKGSGEALSNIYKGLGLPMLPDRSQFEDGTISFEAGLMQMQNRMESGRFYVFDHLGAWFEEYRHYHRKDGLVVKQRDDLLSATRIALMSLRKARLAEPKPWHAGARPDTYPDWDPMANWR